MPDQIKAGILALLNSTVRVFEESGPAANVGYTLNGSHSCETKRSKMAAAETEAGTRWSCTE